MPDRIELFFAKYATAMDEGSADDLSECSVNPMIFVSDDSKRICHSHKDVVKVNTTLLAGLRAGGVVKHLPKITQSMRLSDAVLFVTVRWEFMGSDHVKLFNCFCSYTMQVESENSLKILVAVLDDEQKMISALMKQVQE